MDELFISPFKTNLLFINNLKNLFKKIYIKIRSNKSYKWIVQTQFMSHKLSYKYKLSVKNIEIFPIFNTDFSRNNLKVENTFIYVSNSSKHKNHNRLFKAFVDAAIKTKKKISLNITLSDKEYRSSIYYKGKLPDNLEIVNNGILRQRELNKIYSKTQFLIFPSLNESFGLPLIESINHDCRVIASDLEYVSQVIEPSISFNPLSTISISESIIKAINNENHKKSKILVENKIDTFVKYIQNNV